MLKIKHFFTKEQKNTFNECCHCFETALSYFGYSVESKCFINENNEDVLYVVDIFFHNHKFRAFTTLTLDEFHRKMELIYNLYLYAQKNFCTLNIAIESLSKDYFCYTILQREVDNILKWHKDILILIEKSNSVFFGKRTKACKTLH